jgi:hemin uptake protein HemP
MNHHDNDSEQPAVLTQGRSQKQTGRPAEGLAPRQLNSVELFAGRCELTIVHAEEYYRLRITRNDKLILTK